MADGDHHDGVAGDVVEAPAATATTSCGASCDVVEEEEEEGFTFATATFLAAAGGACPDGRIGPVYPVFGRPRSPPGLEEDPATATVRVPLGQLLLEERGGAGAPSRQSDDGELDGVPAETYCLWSPGGSPALASQSSPARCRKSGSTGSVLRWRQRLIGRSHSDGKEKFVFLSAASSEPSAGGGRDGWSNQGRGGGNGPCGGDGGRKSSFLPYKRDLVGLFANAGAFRRTYHPF
ncbi:hypothetical protein ACP70R_039369 [Stipagrostis hirtigluma subsp. patula]